MFIQRQQEGEKFQKSADHIMELLSETNKDKFEYMAEALKEAELRLKEQMEICDRIQEKYISSLLTEQDTEKEKEWSLSIRETFDKLINAIKMFVAQHSPRVNIEDLNSKEKNRSSGVRLEKLQFQIFQGDVRKYPRFKAEFEKHVKPLCSSNQVAFVLKSYLSEEIKEEVDNLENNVKEIWSCLDKKYGDQGKLVDAIMSEVKCMPTCEDGDERAILNMINLIERAHRDLVLLGLESEISNSTIVSVIEQRMPWEIKKEWIKVVTGDEHDKISKNKFPSLLKLLLQFRERIEYEPSDIRGSIYEGRTVNHGEGRREGRNIDKPVESKKQKCWIHLSNGDHPVWCCRVFDNKSPSEKVDLVRKNNACFACLEIGHVVKNCKRNFRCKHDNCGLEHHQLLHEAHASGIVFHCSSAREKPAKADSTILQLQKIKEGNNFSQWKDLNVL